MAGKERLGGSTGVDLPAAAGVAGPPRPEDAPPQAPMTGRQKLRLVLLVVLKRVRFIAILVAVGMFIGYWDTIKNYWDKWTRPQAAAVRELEPGQEFYCPMHPQVVRSTFEPNGDVPQCPICGMPLSVRKKGEAPPLPVGVTGRVQFTPERVQQAGIKTVPVEYHALSKQITAVGYLTYDESRLSRVVSRVKGYVEKLYVDKTYVTVREGEPLAEIYSPELYSTAQEYLIALSSARSADLAAAARERLRLFDVSDPEIDEIARSGKAKTRLVIRSPQSGYAIEKKVLVGSSVEPGMTLLEVADLSGVWVEAEVYEKDLAFLHPGEKVEVRVEAFPDRVFSGRIALIYPKLDAATRTNRVRFELENPRHELRPGMFAAVRLDTPLEAVEPFTSLAHSKAPVVLAASGAAGSPPHYRFLAVPERAVVDSGTKKVVYVEREPGVFEGVEVELGPRVELQQEGRSADYYPVVKGLEPGDRIAAAGAFLIDAETRLNPAAASTYFGASGGSESGGRGAAPAAPSSRPQPGQAPAGGPKPEAQPQPKEPSAEERKNIAELPAEDRELALAQRTCPITGKPLGSMGVPYKITLRGRPVFLCCKGCAGKAKNAPEETLKKLAP